MRALMFLIRTLKPARADRCDILTSMGVYLTLNQAHRHQWVSRTLVTSAQIKICLAATWFTKWLQTIHVHCVAENVHKFTLESVWCGHGRWLGQTVGCVGWGHVFAARRFCRTCQFWQFLTVMNTNYIPLVCQCICGYMHISYLLWHSCVVWLFLRNTVMYFCN